MVPRGEQGTKNCRGETVTETGTGAGTGGRYGDGHEGRDRGENGSGNGRENRDEHSDESGGERESGNLGAGAEQFGIADRTVRQIRKEGLKIKRQLDGRPHRRIFFNKSDFMQSRFCAAYSVYTIRHKTGSAIVLGKSDISKEGKRRTQKHLLGNCVWLSGGGARNKFVACVVTLHVHVQVA